MLGLSPSDVVMIGDDIDSDVGGAMNAGCQGILVKTGKYRCVSTITIIFCILVERWLQNVPYFVGP